MTHLQAQIICYIVVLKDRYSLGLHLLDHGFKQRDDFNKNFKVSIIDNSSPKTL